MNDWMLKAIVLLTFFAIWALTSLFNRESKSLPQRSTGSTGPNGFRPGDPTTRWSSTTSNPSTTPRRVALGDDDILILPNDPSRPARPVAARNPAFTPRRAVKSRQPAPQPKKPTPPASKAKLAGVNQLVDQHLANSTGMTSLSTITPMSIKSGSDLANSPSAPSKTSAVLTVSTLAPLMSDPRRLREAFIVNELFQAPLALRDRRGHRR